MSVIGPSTGGGDAGVGFLSRNGDTMMGSLGALYGLQAGYGGNLILKQRSILMIKRGRI